MGTELKDKKTRVHTVYKNEAGVRVPGVTTILNATIPKPALVHWAWKLGLEGIDYKKVRDKAADIGTISHYLIECHIKGIEPELDDYTKNDIDKAENAYLAYLDWEKEHQVTPAATELQLVSEEWQYGGTVDLIAFNAAGKPILIDFKTSNGIYKEMEYQVAAYRQLIVECSDHRPEEHYILQIPKDESSQFAYKKLGSLEPEFRVFKCCLAQYNAVKEAK